MHSGDRLRARAREMGFRPTDLAEQLNESSQNINAWFGRGVPLAKIERVSLLLKCSTKWLRDGEHVGVSESHQETIYNPHSRPKTQIIGTAHLDNDGQWNTEKIETADHKDFVDICPQNDKAYALRLRGNQLAPAIRSGWIIGVDPCGCLCNGDLVIVCLADKTCSVKEFLYKRENEYAFASALYDNKPSFVDETNIERIEPISFILPPSKAIKQKPLEESS